MPTFIKYYVILTICQRQMAVIKGQAWNIVQSLKHSVCSAFNHVTLNVRLIQLQDEGKYMLELPFTPSSNSSQGHLS